LPDEALMTVEAGSLARGDLEETAYSLYTRYGIANLPEALSESTAPLADFDRRFLLSAAKARKTDDRTVQVDLFWQSGERMRPDEPLPVAFIHVVGPAGLLSQSDGPLGAGLWTARSWRPGLIIHEQRTISLPESFDPQQHRLLVGLYRPETLQRLPVVDTHGRPLADQAEIEVRQP
jgi:hypothetical protein